MKTKKPDIFLGITMCMLVLAAVLCIVILFVQKSEKSPKPVETNNPALDSHQTDTGSAIVPSDSKDPATSTQPVTPPQPVELKDIDAEGLKAALDESLRGLTSEWQVMVIDPAKETRVSSAINCKVDDWMTANQMTQIYIMGAVFQQAKDGKLVLDSVLEDVKAMINNNDFYAADRLTEQLGGGDAAAGREAVKSFAESNGSKLGFNRPLAGTAGKKNYVSAAYTAEILSKLCRGELVSEDASRQMLDILTTPVADPAIDPGVTDAVKLGFVSDVEERVCICSMGVVQLQNRSYVISVVCNEPVTTNGAKNKVTELIKLAEPYFAE